MRFLLAIGLFIFATSAQAFELDVRDNDPGFMHEVPSIIPDKVLDFATGTQWASEFEGITWGATLSGMVEECIDAPLNPAQWPEFEGQTRPNGKISGVPSDPLTALRNGTATDHIFLYFSRHSGQLVSFSRGGCGDWGDGPWVMVFDSPRTAFSMELFFGDFTTGERYHLEFWDTDGTLLGHQDVIGQAPCIGERGCQSIQTFAWESDVPVAGFSAWPQNGPGVGFLNVKLGSTGVEPPPLSFEDRLRSMEVCLNTQVDFGCPFFLGEPE